MAWFAYVLLIVIGLVCGYPAEYEVHTFTAGIKYDKSVPMGGGSDRLRHPGSLAPFYVSVSTTAKSDYVIDFLEVSVTVDAGADVAFCVIQGGPGSRSLLFQISSNQSDFLAYSYRSYGLWSDEYAKVTAASVRPGTC